MSFLYKYCYVGKGISVHKPHVVFVVIHQHFRAVTHKKGVETRFHSFLADRLSLYNPVGGGAEYAYNLVAGSLYSTAFEKTVVYIWFGSLVT